MQLTSSRPFHQNRLIPTLLSVTGGILTSSLLAGQLTAAIMRWSPTETARQCFYYPITEPLPDGESISRMLLSAAFFGSDALYFDAGEENTGSDESALPSPSGSTDTDSPETPIGEPAENAPSVPSVPSDLYAFDRAAVPANRNALVPMDLTLGAKPGEVLLSDTTKLAPDVDAALAAPYPISDPVTDAPLVLIVHTHGTEAFAPEGARWVPKTAIFRSEDTAENIVAVGAVMAEVLNDAGIPTLHCEIMHDRESYQRSYTLAADTIQRYLAEHPSIRYVFDVHRDAIVRTNGDYVRPITSIAGETSAQVMLLVGTDEKGADHPDWFDNFTVAAKLQTRLTAKYERFARPINIRGASFNEQSAPGSLLIEIGSAGNTLVEAKTAAKWLTYELAAMILEEQR